MIWSKIRKTECTPDMLPMLKMLGRKITCENNHYIMWEEFSDSRILEFKRFWSLVNPIISKEFTCKILEEKYSYIKNSEFPYEFEIDTMDDRRVVFSFNKKEYAVYLYAPADDLNYEVVEGKNINLLTSKRVIELLNKKQANTGISLKQGHKSSTSTENLIKSFGKTLGCIIKL